MVDASWLTVPQAAAALGTSAAYVSRLCREGHLAAVREAGRGTRYRIDPASIAARQSFVPRVGRHPHPDEREAAAILCRAGWDAARIARLLGVREEAVAALLRRLGMPLYHAGRNPQARTTARRAELVAAYRAGETLHAICERYGVADAAIYRALRAEGIAPDRDAAKRR